MLLASKLIVPTLSQFVPGLPWSVQVGSFRLRSSQVVLSRPVLIYVIPSYPRASHVATRACPCSIGHGAPQARGRIARAISSIYIYIYGSFSFVGLKANHNERALLSHSLVPLYFGGRKRSGAFDQVGCQGTCSPQRLRHGP